VILGCDHFGITVTNLERSVHFYEDLGFEVCGRWLRSEPYLQRLVGYFPDVELDIVEMTIPGTTVRLELLEYRNVDGAPIDPANGNPGTAHFCLFVDDIDERCARLAERGAGFVSSVETSDAGPIKGGKVVYMIDPDGVRVELVQLPEVGGDGGS
jgi:catechol 2,3-dioxygenase-like lactoylglutathione lyase family enzyme